MMILDDIGTLKIVLEIVYVFCFLNTGLMVIGRGDFAGLQW